MEFYFFKNAKVNKYKKIYSENILNYLKNLDPNFNDNNWKQLNMKQQINNFKIKINFEQINDWYNVNYIIIKNYWMFPKINTFWFVNEINPSNQNKNQYMEFILEMDILSTSQQFIENNKYFNNNYNIHVLRKHINYYNEMISNDNDYSNLEIKENSILRNTFDVSTTKLIPKNLGNILEISDYSQIIKDNNYNRILFLNVNIIDYTDLQDIPALPPFLGKPLQGQATNINLNETNGSEIKNIINTHYNTMSIPLIEGIKIWNIEDQSVYFQVNQTDKLTEQISQLPTTISATISDIPAVKFLSMNINGKQQFAVDTTKYKILKGLVLDLDNKWKKTKNNDSPTLKTKLAELGIAFKSIDVKNDVFFQIIKKENIPPFFDFVFPTKIDLTTSESSNQYDPKNILEMQYYQSYEIKSVATNNQTGFMLNASQLYELNPDENGFSGLIVVSFINNSKGDTILTFGFNNKGTFFKENPLQTIRTENFKRRISNESLPLYNDAATKLFNNRMLNKFNQSFWMNALDLGDMSNVGKDLKTKTTIVSKDFFKSMWNYLNRQKSNIISLDQPQTLRNSLTDALQKLYIGFSDLNVVKYELPDTHKKTLAYEIHKFGTNFNNSVISSNSFEICEKELFNYVHINNNDINIFKNEIPFIFKEKLLEIFNDGFHIFNESYNKFFGNFQIKNPDRISKKFI